MRKQITLGGVFLFLLSLMAVEAIGQVATGNITGIVMDQSEAILPNAKVTAFNQATGLTRETFTNTLGEYRVPLLPVGVYTLRVEVSGFKAQISKGIKLEIQQTARVDFQLQLGDVQEVITVDTQTPLLETETTVTGTVIKNEQVTNLPLNTRQFMQMVFLSPFATPASRDFRSTEVNRDTAVASGGGGRPEDNNYQIDGFANQETGRNGFSVAPPVDSIAEFKVQTGTASSDFGRGSGTMINVVTKGGTNQIHGTLYDFLRNDLFDARPFFATRKAPLKRNQFGGAIGGPIIKNKVLVFGNYEGFRQRSAGNPAVGRVPTQEERNGLFTTAIRDPLTGQAFPQVNGLWQIPVERMSPISRKILELWPTPNTNDILARNFRFEPPSVPVNRDNLAIRGDYNATSRDNLYVRYVMNDDTSDTPPRFDNGAGGRIFTLKAWTLGGHYSRVFSPRVVNDFGFGYMKYDNTNSGYLSNGKNLHQEVGITNVLAYTSPLFTGTPNITVPGFLAPGELTPNYRTTKAYEFSDSLSWQKGSHGLRFGGEFRVVDTSLFYTGGNGSHEFQNRYSGDNFADFLLGLPSSLSKTARAALNATRPRYLAGFIHDDWKISSKLTLNFGLRYEVETAAASARRDTIGFNQQTGEVLLSENIADRGRIEDFYKNVRPDIKIKFVPYDAPYDTDKNNFAPRLGLSYQMPKNTVVRAGFGIFYNAPQGAALANSVDFAPNTLRPIWTGDPVRPVLRLPDGSEIATGYNPEGTGGPESTVRFPSPLTIFPFYSRDFPYGSNYQWMMSVQHQLTQTFVVETQYLGSRTTHLLGFHNTNYAAPAPGAVQSRLPYPSFARIQGQFSGLDAYYHGMGIKVEQRLNHGLTYLASYTWSKSIDTASTLNVNPEFTNINNFWGSARGLSDFDVRHRFVYSYQYELPIGKGKFLAGDVSSVLNQFIGGWGVRGITAFQSGFSYSPTMNLARANYCAISCNARADRIGNGNLSKSERTLDRFWDFSAFVLPSTANPRAGNGGRNILVGPGINNWDMGVFKNFQISESKRLEFRYEMFNAWNHGQFNAPPNSLENATTFGRITSARDPRISQFVLKLTF